MRILFVGDIVGRSGRAAFLTHVPSLRAAWQLDCVIVNAENAASLLGQENIDGALVGGASLKADSFLAIVAAAAK